MNTCSRKENALFANLLTWLKDSRQVWFSLSGSCFWFLNFMTGIEQKLVNIREPWVAQFQVELILQPQRPRWNQGSLDAQMGNNPWTCSNLDCRFVQMNRMPKPTQDVPRFTLGFSILPNLCLGCGGPLVYDCCLKLWLNQSRYDTLVSSGETPSAATLPKKTACFISLPCLIPAKGKAESLLGLKDVNLRSGTDMIGQWQDGIVKSDIQATLTATQVQETRASSIEWHRMFQWLPRKIRSPRKLWAVTACDHWGLKRQLSLRLRVGAGLEMIGSHRRLVLLCLHARSHIWLLQYVACIPIPMVIKANWATEGL